MGNVWGISTLGVLDLYVLLSYKLGSLREK